MCAGCWQGRGCPTVASEDVLVAAELIRRLYEDLQQGTGGPLHWMVDDWNIGDEQFEVDLEKTIEEWRSWFMAPNAYQAKTVERLPAVADLCRDIFALLKGMPEGSRAAALAWREGLIPQHLKALAVLERPSREAVDEFVASMKAGEGSDDQYAA